MNVSLREAVDAYRRGDREALERAASDLADPLAPVRRRIREQVWAIAEAFVRETGGGYGASHQRSYLFGYFCGLALALGALGGDMVWLDRGES